jgi:hypothetical protein
METFLSDRRRVAIAYTATADGASSNSGFDESLKAGTAG